MGRPAVMRGDGRHTWSLLFCDGRHSSGIFLELAENGGLTVSRPDLDIDVFLLRLPWIEGFLRDGGTAKTMDMRFLRRTDRQAGRLLSGVNGS